MIYQSFQDNQIVHCALNILVKYLDMSVCVLGAGMFVEKW